MYISDAGTNALCTVQKQSSANFFSIMWHFFKKEIERNSINIFAKYQSEYFCSIRDKYFSPYNGASLHLHSIKSTFNAITQDNYHMSFQKYF